MRVRLGWTIWVLMLAALAACAPAAPGRPATHDPIFAPLVVRSAGVPAFDHIIIVVEENHASDEIIGNPAAPTLNRLAARYGLATNYFAVSHPSLPNYLALTGGSDFGIHSDCTTCFVDAPNIVDRLESAGKTWKAYMESMPSACFVGNAGSLYAQKHDPFIYYDDVRTDAARCAKLVPYPQLAADLAQASTTPDFIWITPNLCHDMHDCSVSTGDSWLQNNLPALFNAPAWTAQNSLLLITWDESETAGNQVATLVIGPSVNAGYQSSSRYNHYSLLRTVEAAWGLAPLTANDSAAMPFTGFWH